MQNFKIGHEVRYTWEVDGKVEQLSAIIREIDGDIATLTVYAPRNANLKPTQEKVSFSEIPQVGFWSAVQADDCDLTSCLLSEEEVELCGIWFRPFWATKAGVRIRGHKHEHHHTMSVYDGESDLLGWYENGEICIEEHLVKGDKVEVDAGIIHQITVTQSPYWHECQFASRTKSGHIAGKSNKYFKATI